MFSPEEGIAWQADSLGQIVHHGRGAGVQIMYEPVDGPLDATDNIEKILRDVPGLLLHLDIGHCNLYGRSPTRMLRHFAGRIAHVHLNDNDGRRDLHLPAGCGLIDWNAVAKALRDVGYDSTLTIEVFSRDREYVLLCKRKIEALMGSA